MDPDAPWQGSPKAAPGKAVEAEHDAASRSYVQRNGKTGTVDAKGRARRSRNCRRQPGGTRVAHQPPRRLQPRHGEPPVNRLAAESGDDDAQQMISLSRRPRRSASLRAEISKAASAGMTRMHL